MPVIALYFGSALESLGGTVTFALFAVLAVLSFTFVWRLAPETQGRPLKAIRAYCENGGAWPDEARAAPAGPTVIAAAPAAWPVPTAASGA
jgi:Sugar (and other) transporter